MCAKSWVDLISLQNLSRQSSLVEDRFDDSDDDEFQEERSGMCSHCRTRNKPVTLPIRRTRIQYPVNAWNSVQFKCVEPDALYDILNLKQLYVNVTVVDHGSCISKSPSCMKNGHATAGGAASNGRTKRKSIEILRRKTFFFSCKRQKRHGWMKMNTKNPSLVKSCNVQ